MNCCSLENSASEHVMVESSGFRTQTPSDDENSVQEDASVALSARTAALVVSSLESSFRKLQETPKIRKI